MDYQIIRSARRSVSVEVRPEGVIVRAPWLMPKGRIDEFLRSKQAWIERRMAALAEARRTPPRSPAELADLAARAKQVIPARVRHYAPLVGTDYGRVTIRCQRTRWGSCSAKGNLNFNCLLLLAPPEALDSVVVHELCHRKHMNHSAAFYAEVLRVFPDYRKWNGWLREHGAALLARVPR